MANINPPNPFPLNPIFNFNDWSYGDLPLTISKANKLYIRKAGDNATGLINFNGGLTCTTLFTVNCNATFNETVIIADGSSTSDILQNSTGNSLNIRNNVNNGIILLQTKDNLGTTTTPLSITSDNFNIQADSSCIISAGSNEINMNTSNTEMSKPLYFNGSVSTDRAINNVFYQLQDANNLTNYVGQIYAGTGIINYDNDVNNGSHKFAVNNGSGVQSIPLEINSNGLKYGDNTTQSSAYTGAGALAGSYTLSNITLNSDGKITAISNGSSTIPQNLSINSLTINDNNLSASTGITCYHNNNARLSFSGGGGNNNPYLNAFVANNGVQFDFRSAPNPPPVGIMKFRIQFTFWNSTNWGQTYCLIDFYPYRWTQGQQLNDKYNINNKIDGNANYNCTNAYAPNGRQYWTYQQQFSGVSGANALFIPHPTYFDLYFCIPDNSYEWSACIEALDTTNVQVNGLHITLDLI